MGRLFVKFLLWVFIVVVQMNAYRACLGKERIGLLEIKNFIKSNCEVKDNLDSWVDDRTSTDCCSWDRIRCNSTSHRVTVISLNYTTTGFNKPCNLNLSLFLPFEELLVLDLSHNAFGGFIDSQGLCGLKSLVELGLKENQFRGPLPQCLGNLTDLQVLYLTSNLLSGNPLSVVSELKSLKYLFLSGNKFEGLFSFSALANHSKLEIFQLSSGSELLELETENPSWFPSFQLKIIDLPNRKLNVQTRKIPSFLLYQNDINFIDLSHNNLTGVFPSWILRNNSKLEVMNLMNNSFTGPLLLPSFSHGLSQLEISSNNIDHELPKEFDLLPNLIYLNLSKNSFEGNVPPSIGEIKGLMFLDLSNNNLSGELPGNLFDSPGLLSLILSNNSFQGNIFPMRVFLPILFVLDMHNNQFSGNISVDLLIAPVLSILDTSNNKVSGPIPTQLCDLSRLEILDLSENMLSGSLPSCFNLLSLQFLFLQKNSLNGSIPNLLSGSPDLVALDLRDNMFSGNVPSWINQLPKLRVLLLGGNVLRGNIPTELCQMRNLSILDLSHNSFHGSIPSCFNGTTFGIKGEHNFVSNKGIPFVLPTSHYAQYNATLGLDVPGLLSWSSSDRLKVEFVTKNMYLPYIGDIINLMAGIDLSSNELNGSIPRELGDLRYIRSLNLSHNQLTGVIPISFSNLESVESLDLSNNNLSGEIPTQLVVLTSLGTFNVSYNNLSGSVPDKEQFGTFDERSYRGNPGLCGDMINRSCNPQEAPPPIDAEAEAGEGGGVIDMEWLYWSFGATYVTVLLGLAAVLYINMQWRMLWFYYVHVCVYSLFGIEIY